MRTEMDIAFARINGLDGAERASAPKPANAAAFAGEVAKGAGNLHEMALALEKADVAMRLAVRVRNKVVDAYNEIMRMGV